MNKMKGWLVVNTFIGVDKFLELYAYLQNSAEKEGMSLEIKTSGSLFSCIGDGFREFSLPDFVLFWDKDILLAKRIAALGIPVFNSPKAIEICDNKILTSMALTEARIPSPKTMPAPKTFEAYGYNNLSFLDRAVEVLGLPIVIKEAYGSFGMQVYLAKTREEAADIIKGMGAKDFLFQEYIKESSGRDVRINVVGGKVIASMKRHNNNDFRSNITIGGQMEAYEPTDAEKDVALAAAKAIGLDFAGVDVLFGKDGPLVCEVNSSPHFKTTLQCTGTDISLEIMRHIKKKLNK